MNWLPEMLLQNDEFRRWVLKPTDELNQKWEALLANATDEQQQFVQQARTVLLSLPTEPELADNETATLWQSILDHSQSPSSVQPMPDSGRLRVARWYRIAAVLAVVFLAGWLGWRTYTHRTIAIQTTFGQIRQFNLPDGSQITLNGNSTLSYPANWSNQEQRQVWLEGEAYFKVTKQRFQQQPVKFVVHSADVNIEVLGTRFNVKNRRGLVNVVLNEGKIQISQLASLNSQSSMVMKPGDVVEFSKVQKTFRQQQVKQPEIYSSWTQKVLIFDNTPLQEIARTLEDTYQLKVTFADDSLSHLTFTGNLPASDPNTILRTLAKAFDLQITRTDEQQVTIQSR
ncbi:FecR family protein [Larkinella terrae]|nr:FecR domain-containing protein [Larkinella terrae]